ncbi:MAG: alpha/beta fold hydrolase [Bacilli bacterium]|nr:alpha/beta fold hydrolase [Bacilli bacterium]
MKQKLIKLITSDNIELAGILYEPEEKTNTIIIHVHGLAGNFYENSFIDYQAKAYTEAGISYLVMNNRGNGYFTDLIKKENNQVTYVEGGAAFETMNGSIKDIDTSVNYTESLGYTDIILQGHSFGCNKVAYYYGNKPNKKISKIILLAPCDMVGLRIKELGKEYSEYVVKAKELISIEQDKALLNYPDFPPFDVSAKTFIDIYTWDCPNDIFRYRDLEFISPILSNIKIPVLIQIGNNDEYSLSTDKNIITRYLEKNIENSRIIYIKDTNHGYIGKEQEMSENCVSYIKNN